MRNSKLSEHEFSKGKFVTPFNKFVKELSKENSWFHGRLPEYIWLALVLKHYGREEGLKKCNLLLKKINDYSSKISLPQFSDILALSDRDQLDIYSWFTKIIEIEVLSPLTAIFTYSKYPCFASSFASSLSPEERVSKIDDIIRESSDHQSEFSTDIRFLALYYQLLTKRLHMPPKTLKMLLEYPSLPHTDEKMRMIRPTIRSMELCNPSGTDTVHEEYLEFFWEGVSKLSCCELFSLNIDSEHSDMEKYISLVNQILHYYTDILVSVRPLDNKLLVMMGIATYSYKRVLEVVEHDLYQTIAGRSIVRILVENYIMLKYLLKNETEHDDIWSEYQYYGIGTYTISEEKAAAGFAAAENVQVSVAESNSSENPAVITMSDAPLALQIKKVDGQSDQPIDGATFKLFDSRGNTIKISPISSQPGWFKPNENGSSEFTIPTSGVATIAYLPQGRYELQEFSPPNGYALSLETITAVVGSYNSYTSPATVTIENEPLAMLLDKVDASDKSPLAGVAFRIKDAEGAYLRFAAQADGNYCVTEDGTDSFKTGNDGKAKILYIPVGTYTLEEQQHPGFAPTEAQEFSVTTENTINYPAKVDVENWPLYLSITKADKLDGKPLANVSFKLLDHSGVSLKFTQQ